MIDEKIIDAIYLQVLGVYATIYPNLTEEEIKKRIECFLMVLFFAKDSAIESIKTFYNKMESILDDLKNFKVIDSQNCILIEVYLRHLYYVIDEKKANEKKIYEAHLAKLYHLFDVLDTKNKIKRKDYYEILSRKDPYNRYYEYEDANHAENVLKDDKEIMPFVKAYCARNSYAHSLATPNGFEHFICMLYTMIEMAYRYENLIVTKYLKKVFSFAKYLQNIIHNYEEKQMAGFCYIPLNLRIFENAEYEKLTNIFSKNLVFSEVNKAILAKKINSHVKIIGYAGMGKTTTVEALIYEEAMYQKNHSMYKIPVYISLINIDDENQKQSILQIIAQELNCSSLAIVSKMLEKQMVDLYFDGINEIRISKLEDKRVFLEKLEQFIQEYPALKIIITDRDNNENSILNMIPTFIIDGIDEENIRDFVLGNSKNGELVYEKIKEVLKKNSHFKESLKNAFYLKNLITIVECNKALPDNEDEITECFLKAIVDRERIVKRNYLAPDVLRVLIYLVAIDTKNKDYMIDGNILLSVFAINEILTNYNEKYKGSYPFDNEEMLDLILKLGIFKKIGLDKYTFAHESYFNYFYYMAFDMDLL